MAEDTASVTAILNQSNGILLQELAFVIELKKFIAGYYSTGMPKLLPAISSFTTRPQVKKRKRVSR